MERKIKVAPSLLSADFSSLAEEIRLMEQAGVDMFHIDVMDGHFVPNITVGPCVVKSIRRCTRLPLDAHLMISRPQEFIEAFSHAGADLISVHAEVLEGAGLEGALKRIASFGRIPAVVLNPNTPLKRIYKVLDLTQMVLIMSVFPGFAGQEFIPKVLKKISQLRAIYEKDIQVDGGISDKNAKEVVAAGANVLVAGSYIFGSSDPQEAVRRLKRCREIQKR